MILYIHGFGSSGLGNKAKVLKKHYKEKNIQFLAQKYNLKAVFINSSFSSQKIFKRLIREVKCFSSKTRKFCLEKHHLKILEHYQVKNSKKESLFLLVQKKDKILNFNKTVIYSDRENGYKRCISHSFDNKKIDSFLGI